MWSGEFRLIDNEGTVRAKKHNLGHIQCRFSEIRSNENVVYPWKVTFDMAKADFILDEKTTQQDWRDYAEFCLKLL